jgi:UDP-N-acetylmuramoyl-L-alanyl-D-glutamate--2,6-diaminopimelate ligase
MKLLKDILYKVRIEEVVGNTHIATEGMTMDSRAVRPFHLFAAIRGYNQDGHLFIEKAIASGANCIVCEHLPETLSNEVTYVRVQDSSEALGIIAANYFDNPSEKIKVVGVTGTNGKTTVATLMYELCEALGNKAGLLSTVVNKIHNQSIPSTHTTPNSIELQKLLSQMVEAGCEYAFMEVSSHALDQKRTAGLRFSGAAFTNITHDHLDYHGSFNAYIKAKKLLFDGLSNDAFALINNDDRHAEVMMQNCKGRVYTFALHSMANYRARIMENTLAGLSLSIQQHELYTQLIGEFNAYNLLAVFGISVQLGWDEISVLTALSTLKAPEGRFQYLRSELGVVAIVDYAHTPDALANVLDTIGAIRSGNEKLICVMGCGGDRDKAKRPVMGHIACEKATHVIVTSDNPRSEDPKQIIQDIVQDMDPIERKKLLTMVDREEAIAAACALAAPGDIILIAGKGHEKYQEIQGVKHPFDDYQKIKDQLKTRES